jgi:hypothetical protein
LLRADDIPIPRDLVDDSWVSSRDRKDEAKILPLEGVYETAAEEAVIVEANALTLFSTLPVLETNNNAPVTEILSSELGVGNVDPNVLQADEYILRKESLSCEVIPIAENSIVLGREGRALEGDICV